MQINEIEKPLLFKSGLTNRHGLWTSHSELKSIKIVGMVDVNDWPVRPGNININEPGAEPWFLISCFNQYGASFKIVTNGNLYYGYNDQLYSLDNNIRYKQKSINLHNLSELDQEFIIKVIKNYIFGK